LIGLVVDADGHGVERVAARGDFKGQNASDWFIWGGREADLGRCVGAGVNVVVAVGVPAVLGLVAVFAC
jgi:hypothetical protein